uniref:Mitochondrial fission 1 protein n=3 Tax=Parasteatoda tepidariorum TaxID=114398 RepID=A0A2L2YCY8_PARTP
MKTLLNYSVSDEDTQEHRNNYEAQLATNNVDPEVKFQYAWCLTHSKKISDLKKASALFEEIFKEGSEELKRDSLFYLSVAETKQKNYCTAKKYIDAFLSVESTNVQAEQLKAYIDKQLKKDGVKGMALVGAAAVFGGATAIVVGTLVAGAALGFALKRRYK